MASVQEEGRQVRSEEGPAKSMAEAIDFGGQENHAFSEAGFDLIAERNRKDFAEEFFAKVKAQNADRGGPPALGIHLLMGPEAPVKVKNILQCMSAGGIAPFEMIGRKPV